MIQRISRNDLRVLINPALIRQLQSILILSILDNLRPFLVYHLFNFVEV